MNLIFTVFEIVAPVFILAGVGFTWVKLGFEYRLQFVTRLGVTLAVPCLVFTALMKSEVDPSALSTMTLASLAAYASVLFVFLVLLKAARFDLRTYLMPLVFGNTGNLGLPLALFAFGETGLGLAIVVFAVMSILSFTLGIWVVSGRGNPLSALKEPMVAATLLGALFLWRGWETPRFLTNALDLIGQMAIPLMLITLGVAVARLTPVGLPKAALLSVAKFVICSSLAWFVGLAFGLDETALAILVLQIGTPVGVSSYLIAEKYGADASAVAGLVIVSTVMSVAALPLLLAFLL